ncbi:hypothetical protein K438DRAFT_1760125 [Mycena galopus ATCC 62051]|nr:hypothetical protein K438DRAFT_1760125 [Mycena galopus ATCC 62051]
MSSNHTVAGCIPQMTNWSCFLLGVTCALHEGDRVVVQDNHEQIDNAGEIVAFFERREAHQSLRMAVCLPPLVVGRDPRIATFDAGLGMMRTEMVADVEVPKRAEVYSVSTLRLHVLSPRHRVNVGDRVVVVAGSLYRGYSGRISEFINEKQFDFRRGDIVRAVRSEYQDQIGLVITLYLGGEIEVYICDNAMDNYVDSKTGELKTGYRYTKAATAESLVQRRTSTRKELAEDIRLQETFSHPFESVNSTVGRSFRYSMEQNLQNPNNFFWWRDFAIWWLCCGCVRPSNRARDLDIARAEWEQ